jgi:hypothetical protein
MSAKIKALIISTAKISTQLDANAVTLTKHANTMSLKAWNDYVAVVLGGADAYAVEPHKSRNAPHWLTFDKDSAPEQMLSKFRKLHKDAFKPTSSGNREPVAIPARVTKQVSVLISEVIATGMTKKEFDAMVSTIRSSIEFK